MYRTKAGLRPSRHRRTTRRAAATVGINVRVYRYVAVVVCGMLCGMAGAYLSIVQNNLFVNNMVAGRGFIARPPISSAGGTRSDRSLRACSLRLRRRCAST